ncbi:hypothetical protein AI27_12910 [Sphingomonas sp. BHC-A]|uniref:Uncharacterized protein n=1 Tax=Sphingobium indicum (strain DSM 16412 / CCM 7286 / MTCC 6364 / B90A) TaxID=861109 RepID=A0A1L5BR39_SPHIB|nr:hypothetical protein SIDU_12395 [Sphingobium indicum B90A]KEZ00109.1 hypothetical protein AI27_12910 [Sphingomonas sp. BHC-A]
MHSKVATGSFLRYIVSFGIDEVSNFWLSTIQNVANREQFITTVAIQHSAPDRVVGFQIGQHSDQPGDYTGIKINIVIHQEKVAAMFVRKTLEHPSTKTTCTAKIGLVDNIENFRCLSTTEVFQARS